MALASGLTSTPHPAAGPPDLPGGTGQEAAEASQSAGPPSGVDSMFLMFINVNAHILYYKPQEAVDCI